MTRDLLPDEQAALVLFKANHGPHWKETLTARYWFNARPWNGANGNMPQIGAALHRVRNDLGPSWLYSDACKI